MAKNKPAPTEVAAAAPPGVPDAGGSPQAGDDKPKPEFGTARPADPAGGTPRLVKELERAPAGFARVKVACRNYGPRPTRYVMVPAGESAVADAEAFYLASTGLAAEVERLKKIAKGKADEVEEPALVSTLLRD